MWWTYLFLAMAFQGFFLSALLIGKRAKHVSGIVFLSLFVAVCSLVLLINVGFWVGLSREFIHMAYIELSWPLLLGPLLFLFLKGGRFKSVLKRKIWMHFLPFLLLFLPMLPFYLLSAQTKIELLDNPGALLPFFKALGPVGMVLTLASFLLYAFFIWKMKPSNTIGKRLFSEIRVLWALAALAVLAYYVMVDWLNMARVYDFIFSFVLGISIYLIGWRSIRLDTSDPGKFNGELERYSRSNLTQKKAKELLSQLEEGLKHDQSYLKEALDLKALSDITLIPKHHLSELLNVHLGENFYDFINKYRIEEAKTRLLSDEYKAHKIESIGYDVGFSSRSTFYKAFKKHTGTSPATFQQNGNPGKGYN